MKKYYRVFLYALVQFYGIVAMHEHHAMAAGHGQHAYGMYGNYSMGRDSTGTSWVPASTMMPGVHRMRDDWAIMVHGYLVGIYDHQGGPRGGKKTFNESMLMVTAHKDVTPCDGVGLRGMWSLEPAMGPSGYPLLLQNGETANGVTPLIDRQHPHDMFMELALVEKHQFDEKNSIFGYIGMPGEPALGPTAFIHRFSAFYNPEAPITHHWLDSTHITFGVATLGFVHDWLKLDTSIFTGREPDQHRWGFDQPRFDSYSIRVTANPNEDLNMQVSYGFLKSPEQTEPCIDTHRTTASLTYNKAWETTNWQTTFAWGRDNNVPGHGLNGFLLESTIVIHDIHVLFGRAEYVAKDELFCPDTPLAGKIFKVGKIDMGYIYKLPAVPCFGAGFVFSWSFVPDCIKPVYGGTPFSYMLFLRFDIQEW